MRRIVAFLLVTVAFMSACAGSTPTASGSGNADIPEAVSENIADELPIPETTETAPLELIEPGQLTLFQYDKEKRIYSREKITDLPDEMQLYDVFCAVFNAVMPQETKMCAVNSIYSAKSYVEFSLPTEWLTEYDIDDINVFCNSLAMTLRYGVTGIYDVEFSVNGNFSPIGNGSWEPETLRLLDNPSDETYTDIRVGIPYPGMREPTYSASGENTVAPQLLHDDMAGNIRYVLLRAGYPSGEFDTPQNLPEAALQYIITSTNPMSSHPENEHYDADLMPLFADVCAITYDGDEVRLREHVEETARILYGNDVCIKHQSVFHYRWHETLGVYTWASTGGGWSILPYVCGYEQVGDTITADVVYLMLRENGSIFDAYTAETAEIWNMQGMSTAKEVNAYTAGDAAIHHAVTLRQESDGRLTIQSHHVLGGTDIGNQ